MASERANEEHCCLMLFKHENKNKKSLETRESNIKIIIKKTNPADFHGLWLWDQADCCGMQWRFVKL